MEQDKFETEVDANYEAFEVMLPKLMKEHAGKTVLLRSGNIEGLFADSAVALAAGRERFEDGLFSIQEVTDRPVDLGFFSHALDTRPTYPSPAAD
jgi:hypothetical protein